MTPLSFITYIYIILGIYQDFYIYMLLLQFSTLLFFGIRINSIITTRWQPRAASLSVKYYIYMNIIFNIYTWLLVILCMQGSKWLNKSMFAWIFYYLPLLYMVVQWICLFCGWTSYLRSFIHIGFFLPLKDLDII